MLGGIIGRAVVYLWEEAAFADGVPYLASAKLVLGLAENVGNNLGYRRLQAGNRANMLSIGLLRRRGASCCAQRQVSVM